MLDENSWKTTIDVKSKIIIKSLPNQMVIRKSITLHIFTCLFAFTGFGLLCYAGITDKSFFSIASIGLTIGFLLFLYFASRGLMNRTPQITICKNSISFSNGQIINWENISDTFIERRFFNVSRGNGVERFYLNIKTIFAGEVSKREIPFSFEITGLEYNPKKIGHLVELYKQNSKTV